MQTLEKALKIREASYLKKLLEKTETITKAIEISGEGRTNFYRLLKKHNIPLHGNKRKQHGS